jgi:lysophospholipase L1-like esterase
MHQLIARLSAEPMTRIVALGSANTERGAHSEGCHNWVDWLDVGLRDHFGPVHHTINSGVSGDTSSGMLERFDRDVALYQPHIVVITTGGNDCNPVNGIDPEQFAENLRELVRRVSALPACAALLQTYYSFDTEAVDDEPERARLFPLYMGVIRQVGATEGVALVDHLPRWELLRRQDLAGYRRLMRDPMHLNPLGNAVLGLDLLRWLGIAVSGETADRCAEGLEIQQQMDVLDARE